jgi:hypothetical protein
LKGLRKRQSLARLVLLVGFIGAVCSVWSRDDAAGYQAEPLLWIEAGAGGALPAEMHFSNAHGKLGVLNMAGPIEMNGHPFFEPLGLNSRACVTCHQPANAMSVSVEALRERWRVTKGEDPVFAYVDGSNNPKLPQLLESSHSLLLNRGLFRIGLPWPPRDDKGRPIKPEFTIEVARDPTGVNLDDTYGLKGVNPTVSVFRRPRPVANMRYVMSPHDVFNIKTGTLMAVDPETGKPASMNLMSDARHLTLKQQANGAYRDHQEGRHGALPHDELNKIVAFENQIYVAQSHDRWGGSLVEVDGPPHPYLGRVIYTNDPGRALITGKCVDIGSIVMGQFRGLVARAPYFSNGSAKNLRELVDVHDRRFDMKLTEQEKVDLANFLSVSFAKTSS